MSLRLRIVVTVMFVDVQRLLLCDSVGDKTPFASERGLFLFGNFMCTENKVPHDLMQGEIMTHEKIVNAIYGMWGSVDLNKFLFECLVPSLDSEPLSSQMFSEINSILTEHQKQFPLLATERNKWY